MPKEKLLIDITLIMGMLCIAAFIIYATYDQFKLPPYKELKCLNTEKSR
jgi:uncharacterized membrane protein YobD (UPF0266 family)